MLCEAYYIEISICENKSLFSHQSQHLSVSQNLKSVVRRRIAIIVVIKHHLSELRK
jgi:hypothetical protein